MPVDAVLEAYVYDVMDGEFVGADTVVTDIDVC